MSQRQRQLHEEIKKFIVNVSWTHKIQVVYSDILASYAKWVRVGGIILSALVSSGLIYILLSDKYWAKVVTAIASIFVTVLTALRKEFDFEGASERTKRDANMFWELREKATHLLYILTYNTANSESVATEFNELVETRNKKMPDLINAPQKAVRKASELLKLRKDDDYEEDYKYLIPYNLKDILEEE
ncbi:SLATT domain-containing protein [uncultured Abiotrophia sp.]|uniref:SLATT domain-containing protein n=1 Tax=uncultured Abiotrophia sp. TaxID=316094 RepID=UPI0026297FB9|nr:SLATT domain-containing protein [uncultured Abiotrophia sp.]